MGLSERLKQSGEAEIAEPLQGQGAQVAPEVYQAIKAQLHARLIDQLDLESLGALSPEALKHEVGGVLGQAVSEGALPLNRRERAQMTEELLDEMLGLGPLEALLADPTVSDILVNTGSTIYVERGGKLELTALRFRDNAHLQQTIGRIVAKVGRRVDESSPMVDARLSDGSRVNAIIPPLSIDGPVLSIRRFGGKPLTIERLVESGALSEGMRRFLDAAVKGKLNVLISGGTGTGKTTMLNALSGFIPGSERIVTIEDAAELRLQQPHVVRLETRPPNVEGKGEVSTRELVKNSLRMRPDRIIVGEIRSVEVIDMLQAMNTGHEGSMATVHANTPRDALTRMSAMIGMSGLTLSEQVVTQMVARAIDLIVQLHRGTDGKRRIVSISEITGTEGSVIQMQEIFVFVRRGMSDDGNELGDLLPSGVRPRCLERLARAGFDVDPSWFQAGRPA
jgi:pilus assembly protein CpaF